MTSRRLCPKCDKSKHNRCTRGTCECLCRVVSLSEKPTKEEEPIVPAETLDKWNSDLEKARSVFGIDKK